MATPLIQKQWVDRLRAANPNHARVLPVDITATHACQNDPTHGMAVCYLLVPGSSSANRLCTECAVSLVSYWCPAGPGEFITATVNRG